MTIPLWILAFLTVIAGAFNLPFVLFRVHRTKARLGELPIIFENRRHGKSKVNSKEALRSIAMILFLGVQNFFGTDRLVGPQKLA